MSNHNTVGRHCVVADMEVSTPAILLPAVRALAARWAADKQQEIADHNSGGRLLDVVPAMTPTFPKKWSLRTRRGDSIPAPCGPLTCRSWAASTRSGARYRCCG